MYRPDLGARGGPRYRALAQTIIEDIEAGRLADGHRLPPQRDLAVELGVTIGTISRAYALVERQGLVSAEVGRGTFVRRPPPPPARTVASAASASASDLIDLTINRPADRTCYREALKATLAGLDLDLDHDLLDYAPRAGSAQHRRAAADWLVRSGVGVDPAHVILTGGAHQAIVVALAALVRPGEPLLAESLTYPGVRGMAASLHLRVEAVPLDEGGLRPDALEAACRQTGGRVLFVNPTLHNPTTATLSDARRRAIVEIARRHDLVIIEDDVYGLLKEQRPASFFSLAPERTVHISSASKALAPGLRLGLLAAPDRLQARLADVKYDLMLSGAPLPAEIFRIWVADGTADRLLERQRRAARARQVLAGEVLGRHEPRTDPAAFHLWLPLPAPWRTSDFAAAAAADGFAVAPGHAFATGRSHAPHAVRVSLSAPSDDAALVRALRGIARLLDRPPEPRRGLI